MHIGSHSAKRDRCLSELCQIPPETQVKHRELRGDSDAHRCCGKSLIGSALVGFRVLQHARADSISKRARSTTPTSLRLESTSCKRSGSDYRKMPLQILLSWNAIRFSGLRTRRKAIIVELCRTSQCRRSPYSLRVASNCSGRFVPRAACVRARRAGRFEQLLIGEAP